MISLDRMRELEPKLATMPDEQVQQQVAQQQVQNYTGQQPRQ